MTRFVFLSALALCGVLAGTGPSFAQSTTAPAPAPLAPLRIEHAHARATAAGQAVGGGFMTIHNPGAADKLMAASAPVAKAVEMHTMQMDGEVMRMRQLDAIVLPAGQTVTLQPGGLHLMFMGLKAPLQADTSFPMTLRFEKAGEVTVQVKVVRTVPLPTHVMTR